MSDSPTRRILGPFNRVEGDLEIDIEIHDGTVSSARVNSPLFRGFEQILQGKDPLDALVYTPRICGICSVAQSVAAARALGEAQNIFVAPNGKLATNLILATENLADHLSHFYLFFMPDFARDDYAEHPWFQEITSRFKAQTGAASREALKSRAEFLHITGILAGKWPHSLAIQPGGSTRSIEPQERVRLLAILGSFRQFLESTMFADSLESLSSLSSSDELDKWTDAHRGSDFGRFLQISKFLQLENSGKIDSRFMSYGSYETEDGHLFSRGLWHQESSTLNPEDITEDISSSWLQAQPSPRHPYDGSTIPDSNFENGYSWCKAPRLGGEIVEVGALARQQVNGHPLIRDLIENQGANVRNRVIARILELSLVVPEMESWVKQLKPREPFCTQMRDLDEAQGAGLVEAARGSLGHWVRVKHGRILNYQIIAPTTWNFSPRDTDGQPGPLELALEGTPVGDDGKNHVAIQHIVRSFDPCMVCTVH